jgi:hypothetical protein
VQRWAGSGLPEFYSPYGYEIPLSSTAPRPAEAHSATCPAGAGVTGRKWSDPESYHPPPSDTETQNGGKHVFVERTRAAVTLAAHLTAAVLCVDL